MTALIQISVGKLPHWYNEREHDPYLEQAVEAWWKKGFPNTDIDVVYNYTTENAVVSAYDYDGNLLWERDDHDLEYAFNYALNEF